MGVFGTALFYLFVYLPAYFLFTLVQRLYWFCNGMSDIVSQIEDGQLYERSAQVFDIRWKLKKEPFQLLGRRNFIATHRNFEHPNYVLNNNVSLLVVQIDRAIFVEVPSDYDIFNCRKSPFIHLGQFTESIRIITLPISSFVRCANELGDPRMKVVWLHSTGRCGSTAMSMVFEAIPNCTTVSEPMCIFTARNEASLLFSDEKYQQWVDSKDYKELFIATARMMGKPNQHNPDVLFIKNCTLSGVMDVKLLENFLPDHINLFLYRDCLDTVQSYTRSLNSHFILQLILKLRCNAVLRYLIRSPSLLIKGLAAPESLNANPWLMNSETQLSMTAFGLFVIQWGCYCHHYSHIVTSGSSVRAIRYEDIVKHKHATLTALFKFCGISLDYVEMAKKSLEKDSQEGTVLSMSTLGKFKNMHITEEMEAEANMYLKFFGLAPLRQPTYLPKVISPMLPSNGSGDHYNGTSSSKVSNGVANGHISITISA